MTRDNACHIALHVTLSASLPVLAMCVSVETHCTALASYLIPIGGWAGTRAACLAVPVARPYILPCHGKISLSVSSSCHWIWLSVILTPALSLNAHGMPGERTLVSGGPAPFVDEHGGMC